MDENPGMVEGERIKLAAQNLGMDPDILRRAEENFVAQMSDADWLANEWAKAQERRLRAKMDENPLREEIPLDPRSERVIDILERVLHNESVTDQPMLRDYDVEEIRHLVTAMSNDFLSEVDKECPICLERSMDL